MLTHPFNALAAFLVRASSLGKFWQEASPARRAGPWCCAAMLLWASPSRGYDSDVALANLTEDFADCVTWFNWVRGNAIANHWDSLAADYKVTVDKTLDVYMDLMKDKPTGWALSKLELKQKLMAQKYEKVGWDGLSLTYQDLCKGLMEDPKPRIQYWLDKPALK